MRALIVGCGITGGLVRYYLSRHFFSPEKAMFHCIDASNRIGGRMHSLKFSNSFHFCHIGAQYITQFTEEHHDLFEDFIGKGYLQLLDIDLIKGAKSKNNERNFIPPNGFDNMVNQLFQDDSIELSTKVKSIEYNEKTNAWKVTKLSSSNEILIHEADSIVLTGTSVDIIHLLHNTEQFDFSGPWVEALQNVQYSTR